MKIKSGARASLLSRAQFQEILEELSKVHPEIVLEPIWASSPGDRDHSISLRTLRKCDFFTRDLDQMLLRKEIRIAIHSAKDLPEPLPEGLTIVCLTQGQDPRDSLVLRENETIDSLKPYARIATSSIRREEAIKKIRSDLSFIDLRGTIFERLEKLDTKETDGVVIAESALIRLKQTHLNRLVLPGETAPMQGRLAVVARCDDSEMKQIFRGLNYARGPNA